MLKVKPNVTIHSAGVSRKYKNMAVQTGLDWMMDKLADLATEGLDYVAIGSGTAAVTIGDSQLGNELLRKSITALTRDVSVVAEVFFSEAEANFTWKEIGLYAGGTMAANSGKLIARALVEEAKDDMRTATITWEIGLQNA